MEDQHTKTQSVLCLKCLKRKEREKEEKLDQLLEYMQVEVDLRETALEREREAETYRLQHSELMSRSNEYYMYASLGLGLACIIYHESFKNFMKQTTESKT